MKSTLSLSLCMIVKNEEQWIASCINSVRHLVQEIIVVDTGSTDGTREAAARNSALVFDFPWRDDFAAARNHSLERATGDWILVLDADEVLAPVSVAEMAGLLSARGVEGYFVNIRNYLGGGERFYDDRAVRLFRNKRGYRFEGPIHEQVAGVIKRLNGGEGLAFSPLLIHHFGYLDQQLKAKDKHNRNTGIIRKALAGRPEDPFLFFCLGLEHFQRREISEGIEQLEKALVLSRGNEGYFRDLLVTLCWGLLKAGKREKLAFILGKALLMLPDDPDMRLLKGLLLFSEGRPAAAVDELQQAVNASPHYLPPHFIYSLLGDCLHHLGRYEQAEEEYFRALCLNPCNLYPLTQILGLKQRRQGRLSWVELSRFAPLHRKKFLAGEAMRIGEAALALCLVLLSVVELAASGSTAALITTFRELKTMMEEFTDALPAQDMMHRYLLTSIEEMYLYAQMAGRDLGHVFFRPPGRLFDLACSTLDLVVKGFCPAWRPVYCSVMDL